MKYVVLILYNGFLRYNISILNVELLNTDLLRCYKVYSRVQTVITIAFILNLIRPLLNRIHDDFSLICVLSSSFNRRKN